MRPIIAATIIVTLAHSAYCFEGTPNPGILDGLKFDGWVKVVAGDQGDQIQCGAGELKSNWAANLGFDVLKWKSSGEISGTGESETLSFDAEAVNKEKSRMFMHVTVVNRKTLNATIKISKTDGTTEETTLNANLRPKYLDEDAYKQALKECGELDVTVKEAPAHYIAPDPAVEKMLDAPLPFSVRERPLRQCLDWLGEHFEVLVYSDLGDFDSAPKVTVVDAKNAREVFEQICKAKKYEYLVRGRAIVITYPERAAKLRLKPDYGKQK